MVLSHGWPDDIAKRDGGAILNHHRTVHGIGCGWNESIERQPLAFSGTDSLDLKLAWKYQFFHYHLLTLIFLRNFILPLSTWTSTDSHRLIIEQAEVNMGFIANKAEDVAAKEAYTRGGYPALIQFRAIRMYKKITTCSCCS